MKTSTAALLVVALGGASWLAYSQFAGTETVEVSDASLMTVEATKLQVDVSTSATIYASKSEIVRSEIEGGAKILWLAEEGRTIKKGAKVAELDVSGLKDKSENQAISVSRARAAMINSEKNLEIQRNQNASDLETANNNVLFAQLELEKFLGRAEMSRRGGAVSDILSKGSILDDGDAAAASGPSSRRAENASSDTSVEDEQMGVRKQELVAARADIEIAREEVKRAQNRLKWTKELWADKYVTDQDLEADQLSLKKAEKQLTLAVNKAHILENYTLLKTERELMAGVKEAKAELRRTQLRCEARIVQEEADLNSKKQEFDLEKAKLEKWNAQIRAGKLYAPADGLVVYATVGDRRRREPIDLGTTVREGQAIIKLPDVTSMRLKASVAESVVSKIKAGQRVEIRVQTVQDKVFYGRVTRVAKVHDSNNSWYSDTKEYRTDIAVFGNHPELREGVSATATIKVADLEDVLTAPVQAVQRAGRVIYVWAQTAEGPQERMIEKGMSNERRIEVAKGLSAGDRIWLATPPGVTRPLFEEENARLAAAEEARKKELEKASAASAKANAASAGPSSEASSAKRSGGGDRAARAAKFTAFLSEVKARFPEDASKLSNPMALFRDAALREKVKNDSVLGPKYAELMSASRRGGGSSRRGQGGSRQGGRRDR